MWAKRHSITSVARPNLRFTPAIFAALILLPAVLHASANVLDSFDDNVVSVPGLSLSSATVADDDFPAHPVTPVESDHFTVLSTQKAIERSGVLETAYAAFMTVTNTSPEELPPHIRVVIFKDFSDYARVTHSRAPVSYADGEIASFEPTPNPRTNVGSNMPGPTRNLNAQLVEVLAAQLFDYAAHAPGRRELNWLRKGVIDAVEAAASNLPLDERQASLRAQLSRIRPVNVYELAKDQVYRPGKNDLLRITSAQRQRQPQDWAAEKRLRLTAVSLTYYLMSQDRGLSFSFLLRNLRAGMSLDQALAAAYPGKVRGLRELYDRWIYDEVGTVRPIKERLR